MNIVRKKRSERKTTSEDREIFYPSDWRIYCCNSSNFFYGEAHFLFIKLSYAELGIQPQEVGEQILFAGYRFFLSGVMLLFFFKALGKDMSFKKRNGEAVSTNWLISNISSIYMFLYWNEL